MDNLSESKVLNHYLKNFKAVSYWSRHQRVWVAVFGSKDGDIHLDLRRTVADSLKMLKVITNLQNLNSDKGKKISPLSLKKNK